MKQQLSFGSCHKSDSRLTPYAGDGAIVGISSSRRSGAFPQLSAKVTDHSIAAHVFARAVQAGDAQTEHDRMSVDNGQVQDWQCHRSSLV